MFNKLNGYKTYIIAVLMILYAILGLIIGKLGDGEAIKIILEAMAISSLRHGIKNSIKKK